MERLTNNQQNLLFPSVTFVTNDLVSLFYLWYMQLSKTTWITLAGIASGAIAGYAYYYYVGCASGTCMITSRPWNSTLYGGLMGFLLFRSFLPEKNKQ
jgi:ABC-type nitrate/sulfonate/bicarbonate transport system permease component